MAEFVIMPRLSLNEETNYIGEIYVSEGDKVKTGDALFSIETDKSTMDINAESDGTVLKVIYSSGDIVNVLNPVCVIGQPGEAIPEFTEKEKTKKEASAGTIEGRIIPAKSETSADKDILYGSVGTVSPRARKLAEENGIADFDGIRATGANGRVVEADVINFMETYIPRDAATDKTVPLTKIRQIIAENMMSSLHNSAQLTMHREADASGLKRCREKYKKSENEDERGITIGDLIIYATVKTLEQFPCFNATIGEMKTVEHSYVNIGIATDTERGLMVPTVFKANTKSLRDISKETKELAGECRMGKINPEKLHGGTFTVTNLGSFGVKSFTPIINPPQVAILGVGGIFQSIRDDAGRIEIYPALNLSLTVDHRVIDGAPGARFLKSLCENIESIESLI